MLKIHNTAIISFTIFAITQILILPLIITIKYYPYPGIGYPMFWQFQTMIQGMSYENKFFFWNFVVNIVIPLILSLSVEAILNKVKAALSLE